MFAVIELATGKTFGNHEHRYFAEIQLGDIRGRLPYTTDSNYRARCAEYAVVPVEPAGTVWIPVDATNATVKPTDYLTA